MHHWLRGDGRLWTLRLPHRRWLRIGVLRNQLLESTFNTHWSDVPATLWPEKSGWEFGFFQQVTLVYNPHSWQIQSRNGATEPIRGSGKLLTSILARTAYNFTMKRSTNSLAFQQFDYSKPLELKNQPLRNDNSSESMFYKITHLFSCVSETLLFAP